MVDIFQNLLTVMNTISTVSSTIDKITADKAPKENKVEVVERPASQNVPPININLTINVYKSDPDALGLPLLAQNGKDTTINL